jgi:hypothetical protein
MSFEQQWLEYDYNPFILFSSSGKILSLNSEAQFLLGSTSKNEIFELATAYANITFGFKTTFAEMSFGRYKFFGLTVGYENEEEIGIKLYQSPSFRLNKPKPIGELTNIFTLIDLCISTNSINSDIHYTKEFDPTIPDIIINVNNIIKILNKTYSCFNDNQTINTKVYFRIGEHINFENKIDGEAGKITNGYKKYSIFSIEISAKNLNKKEATELKALVESSDFYIDIRNTITINIPMILS